MIGKSQLDFMRYEYYVLFIFISLCIILGFFIALSGGLIAKFIGVNQPSREKNQVFECGFPGFGDARSKIDVRFYIVALMFLIFDLELSFMLPWGLIVKSNNSGISLSWNGFFAMILFLFFLLIGFVYEWKKGALEWE